MRKTIFATIITAGLLIAVPAHADDLAYCKSLSKAAMGVAEGRDKGQDKIIYQMVALGKADAPIEVKVDMMDVIDLIYNDETMRQMAPAKIGRVLFEVCLHAQRKRKK